MKKAEMGMGTLIIFISMILAASMVASVLISTTTKLQNKALDTGKLTSQEVGTGVMPIEVYAEDGQDQNLSLFFTTLKLSAGSDAIRFSDLLVSMSLNDDSQDYSYNDSMNCETPTTLSNHESGFGIKYQISGTSYQLGYLNKGDVAKICLKSPRNVTEGEDFKLQIIPKVGSITVIDTTTPDLMVDKRISIYP